MLALGGTLGATGRAPVAVADAAVVLSQGLCSSVSAATDISVSVLPHLPPDKKRLLKKRLFLEQSFFIWTGDGDHLRIRVRPQPWGDSGRKPRSPVARLNLNTSQVEQLS